MCGRCLFSPTVSVLWCLLYCVLHVSSSCVNMWQMRTCLGKSWKVEIGAKERRMDDRSEVPVWLCLELWWSVEDANCCVLMRMSFLYLPSLMLAYVRCSSSKVCIMKSSTCTCQVLAFILKVTERFEEWYKLCAQVLNMTALKTCETFFIFLFNQSGCLICCCPLLFFFSTPCLFISHFGYVFFLSFWLYLFFPLWLYLFLFTLVISFVLTLVMSFSFHFYCHPLMNFFNVEQNTLTMGKWPCM